MRAAVFVSALLFPALAAVPAAAQVQTAAPGAVSPPATEPRPDARDVARHVFAVIAGEIAANTGHPAIAYAELLKAAQDLDSAELYRRAGEIALRSGAPDKALTAALAWRKAMPESREARIWVVQLQLMTGRLSEAGASIAQDLARTPEPQRGQAVASLLPLAAQASDPVATLAMMRTALADQKQFAQTDVVLGLLRARSGDQKGGFADSQHALFIDPGLAPAAALLLQLYTVNPQEADAAMQKFATAQPTDTGLRLAWAQAAIEQQRDGIALAQLQQLVKDAPGLAPAWLLLGHLQTEFGEPAKAVVSLQAYLRLARAEPEPPVLTPAYIALSEASRELGDDVQANRWLDQVVPDANNRVALLSSRAAILVRQGKVDEALRLIDTLPDATAEQRKTRLLARAQTLREAQRYEASYRLLQTGLKRAPGDVDLLYEAAMMADKSGHMKEMQQLLRKAIARDPESQPAFNALGYTMAERGENLPEARKLIARALELSPGNPFVLDSMGWVEYRMGHTDQALDLLQQAYDARPDPEIGVHLGEVLWQLGQRDKARAVWKDAQRRAPQDQMVRAVLQKFGVEF
jgi:tetratricopeptide (TPR) repeat protein